MPHQTPAMAFRQPLLAYDGYFDDGLEDGNIVPPNPFAGQDDPLGSGASQQDVDDETEEDDNKAEYPTRCFEKLGLFIGIIIGMTVQLSTLSGSFVNVSVWGTEDGPYATTTFVVWCCLMSSMFFVAFGLLRFLVQMTLQMVYKMEHEKSLKRKLVVDVPSDNPMPTPSLFPSVSPARSLSNTHKCTPQDEHEVLEDVMWHMKLHYVLGVNLGIGLSWLVTNLALGDHRVSIVFSLAPPLLGLTWLRWMKQGRAVENKRVVAQESFEPTVNV